MLLTILKANGKLKDLFIPFMWASRGFFLSRGLEIKPSGYEDEKECKRPKEADSAKKTEHNDHKSSSVPFDMALTQR